MPATTRKKLLPGRRRSQALSLPPSTALTRFLTLPRASSLQPRPSPGKFPPQPAAPSADPVAESGHGAQQSASDGAVSVCHTDRCRPSAQRHSADRTGGDQHPPLQKPSPPVHVGTAAILQVPGARPLHIPPASGLLLSPILRVGAAQIEDCSPTAQLDPHPSGFNPFSPVPGLSCSSSLPQSPPAPSLGPRPAGSMPPKRRNPPTPLSKQGSWSVPPDAPGGQTPPLARPAPPDEHWDPVTDSQSEGSDSDHARLRPGRGWSRYLRQLPTKDDFKTLVAEVKEACKIEIAAIRQDLGQVTGRVDSLEADHDSTRRYVSQLQAHISAQDCLLQDTRLHLEDLDNRGRRNNIRVRGVPEAETTEDIPLILEAIFNQLLGLPLTTGIRMDRAHRALRPKRASGPPRDIICRIHDFALKERIMSATRNQRDIQYAGAAVQLYPDLAWMTLQRRRQLQPLLAVLRTHAIPYRWGFPFSLTATRDGKSTTLRSPADLPAFCGFLGVDQPPLPEWEKGVLPAAPPPVWRSVKQKRRRPPNRDSPGSTSSQHASEAT